MRTGDHGNAVSRRRFLVGVGGAAATLAVPAGALARSSPDEDEPGEVIATNNADGVLELDEIQGNVLAGFNKDHQALVFVTFPAAARAARWLATIRRDVATSRMVAEHNVAFRSAVERDPSERSAPTATWINLALTHSGLAALGRPRQELLSFPEEFRIGMRRRADILGDRGASDPSTWPEPYRRAVHGVLVIAADSPADLDAALRRQLAKANEHDLEVVHVQRGATRSDERGHEHFGFRDGVSQPGIRGFTPQLAVDVPHGDDPDTRDGADGDAEIDGAQGIPGQDLLWPGEFVLGYPRQSGPGGGADPGPVATAGPAWTRNGSFLVFRRLRQDVSRFRGFVRSLAEQQGMTVDLAGAKIVGRYRSGAALAVAGAADTDPGVTDPGFLGNDLVTAFEFGEEDPDGELVPHAAHIRKTYPRDDDTEDGGEEDTQTHRMVRRGIPYGPSFDESDPEASSAIDRGLLFLCYQSSIARQFEFVQRRWVNDPDHPRTGAGHDPVISQTAGARTWTLPGGRTDHVQLMRRFVTTTGGEYFFSPSLSALEMLAQTSHPSRGGPPPRRREQRRRRD